MGSRTVERIPGNSHILHHQRWHPVRILQQLSAGWWGGVWWHVGTHQRRLHDIFCSLYGGVDNLLHSTTFWMTGIHKTLNMNISVEVNCQERGTPQLEGSQCSSIQYDFFSVQCIMGILVWLTGSCKNTVMNNKMYICLIQGFLLRQPLSHFPHVYISFFILMSSSLSKHYRKGQLRLVAIQCAMEDCLDVNQNRNSFVGLLQGLSSALERTF